MDNQWVNEWPKEVGKYWFYGWLWGRKVDILKNIKEPQLNLVDVMQGQEKLIYITKNTFILESEKHIGLFLKVELPELPDISKLN
jgi:hypothetical protein